MQVVNATGAKRGQHADSDNHFCAQATCLHPPAGSHQGSCLQQEDASITSHSKDAMSGKVTQPSSWQKEAEHEHYALPVAQSPVGFSPLMMFATVVAHRSLHPQTYSHSSKGSTRSLADTACRVHQEYKVPC